MLLTGNLLRSVVNLCTPLDADAICEKPAVMSTFFFSGALLLGASQTVLLVWKLGINIPSSQKRDNTVVMVIINF